MAEACPPCGVSNVSRAAIMVSKVTDEKKGLVRFVE